MAALQAKRIVALLLATLVIAGFGLRGVEAGTMPADMTIAADMPAGGDCGPCGGSSDAMACPVASCSPSVLTMTATAVSAQAARPSRLAPASSLDPGGWPSSPDPNPPQMRAPARLG